ncbi:MAG: hypothetical protein LBE25_09375 [Arthrobacter sp.]|jgi:hypothetical protein|nr:hypothetical protein [Arthrobacter sp.]
MYFYTDDDLRRVDRKYLGPKKRTFPFRVTYSQIGVIVAYAMGTLFVANMLGLDLTVFPVLAAVVTVNALLIRKNFELMQGSQGLLPTLSSWISDVSTPRKNTATVHYEMKLKVSRYSSDDSRVSSWWERLVRGMTKK